ncbi:MAG: metal ABC transporter ATP-binding protein [Bacillota bacterium]|nr:metal ABC transporter ATP-binding protein [Bacillota bacterium]
MRMTIYQPPVVEFTDVTVTLRGRTVLDRVNLAIEHGSFVAVLGPNGAGKTTLVRVILGLLQPRQGRVHLFGAPPAGRGHQRHLVGYLPQRQRFDPRFPVSALDTAVMGRVACIGLFRFPSRADRQAAARTLERIGLTGELQNRQIGELSGGQQQLALLARALCSHTRLLILDEPTTGLDAQAQQRFYTVVQELQRDLDLTVIVVSHDLAAVTAHADRFLLVEGGRVSQTTPPDVARRLWPELTRAGGRAR